MLSCSGRQNPGFYAESGCSTKRLERQALDNDILLHELLQTESMYYKNGNYLSEVQEMKIQDWMRADLVEWMLEVCDQYKLSSLSLAVNYVDRFLSKVRIGHDRLQCVGAAALLIATKIKEIIPLNVSHLCACADNAFNPEILKMTEEMMLSKMEWKLNSVTADEVAEILIERFCFPEKMTASLRKYTLLLVEMSFVEYEFVCFDQSTIACGALLYALYLVKHPSHNAFLPIMAKLIGLKEGILYQCRDLMDDVFHRMVQPADANEDDLDNDTATREYNQQDHCEQQQQYQQHSQQQLQQCDSLLSSNKGTSLTIEGKSQSYPLDYITIKEDSDEDIYVDTYPDDNDDYHHENHHSGDSGDDKVSQDSYDLLHQDIEASVSCSQGTYVVQNQEDDVHIYDDANTDANANLTVAKDDESYLDGLREQHLQQHKFSDMTVESHVENGRRVNKEENKGKSIEPTEDEDRGFFDALCFEKEEVEEKESIFEDNLEEEEYEKENDQNRNNYNKSKEEKKKNPNNFHKTNANGTDKRNKKTSKKSHQSSKSNIIYKQNNGNNSNNSNINNGNKQKKARKQKSTSTPDLYSYYNVHQKSANNDITAISNTTATNNNRGASHHRHNHHASSKSHHHHFQQNNDNNNNSGGSHSKSQSQTQIHKPNHKSHHQKNNNNDSNYHHHYLLNHHSHDKSNNNHTAIHNYRHINNNNHNHNNNKHNTKVNTKVNTDSFGFDISSSLLNNKNKNAKAVTRLAPTNLLDAGFSFGIKDFCY